MSILVAYVLECSDHGFWNVLACSWEFSFLMGFTGFINIWNTNIPNKEKRIRGWELEQEKKKRERGYFYINNSEHSKTSWFGMF